MGLPMSLTPREQVVLIFLRAHYAEHGRTPSYSEIIAGTGIKSRSNIAYIIDTLAARRYLRRAAGRACNIELLQTEDYHLANCDCAGCAEARYQRGLKLVQALQVAPPVALTDKFQGLRPLAHLTRLEWLRPTNDRRKPRLSRSKAFQNSITQQTRDAQ